MKMKICVSCLVAVAAILLYGAAGFAVGTVIDFARVECAECPQDIVATAADNPSAIFRCLEFCHETPPSFSMILLVVGAMIGLFQLLIALWLASDKQVAAA